jgi:endonuclease-8
MPEGDTIHHAARRIGAVLLNSIPEQVLTPHPRHRAADWPAQLAGRAVRSVDAHGKHLFVRFEGELTLHSHLRMSGSWGVHREGARWKRAARRAWLVMRTDGWSVVQFDGPVLELMSESRTRLDRRLAALGQDVIGARFDHARFLGKLRADDPGRPIGDALLDQQIVAGIGNVWKSESCFATGLDPWRPAGRVSDEEAIAVVEFAREHMRRSADKDGFSTRPKAVYKRAGMPCERCGARIRSRGQWENNRNTFWCPGCQG